MENKTLKIENAQVLFKNFSGRETEFNRAGERNFSVIIPDQELAEVLASQGWNIKTLRPKDEGDMPTPFVSVKIRFNDKGPNIYMITRAGKTRLDEASVATLDMVEFKTCDLIINPYEYHLRTGDHGISAYLKTMYVVVEEDEFAYKYADDFPIDE